MYIITLLAAAEIEWIAKVSRLKRRVLVQVHVSMSLTEFPHENKQYL